jgi:carboxypeptidase C (cathepsin A)
MTANPSMKVLSTCGYYDLVCAYAANAHVARALDPAIRDNVTAKAYGGGHAIYTDRAAQMQMKADVEMFIQAARVP